MTEDIKIYRQNTEEPPLSEGEKAAREYRRQQENGAYLRQRYKVTSAWRGAVDRWHQRRDYRFFKCPSCRTRLRVPRGKGKINIRCPKCSRQFIKKT